MSIFTAFVTLEMTAKKSICAFFQINAGLNLSQDNM